MTKLRPERPYKESDPAVVISVPDVTKPYKPPKTEADRHREKKEREVEAARLAEELRPERERQRRREIKKELKVLEAQGLDGALKRSRYQALRDELQAITRF